MNTTGASYTYNGDVAYVIQGRPPMFYDMQDSNMAIFCAGSKIYAQQIYTADTTQICAFTARTGNTYHDMKMITQINLYISENQLTVLPPSGDCDENDACPWTVPLSYIITDWSYDSVRLDCLDSDDFWCVVPRRLLP